jgi:cytochrome c-type biogenesis protein CcmH
MSYAWLALWLLAGSQALAPAERARVNRLENALLAPCCYSEVLARHTSDTALAMKRQIAGLVAQGRSDREILDHYKKLYGSRVLAEPEGLTWWWAQMVPIAAALAGLAAVLYLLRRWRLATV